MLKRASQLLLWALLAAFAAGLGRFVYLRFAGGELYPQYSTLRADPLGTKAFYESLREMQGLRVERQLKSLQQLKADSHSTIFVLGTTEFASARENTLESLARNGARVFVSLNALGSKGEEREEDRINNPSRPQDTSPNEAGPSRGIEIRLIDPLKRNTNRLEAVRTGEQGGPASIPWFGRYCFVTQTNGWEILYEVKNKPVVLRKKAGLGSIVLCADSFLFSNEALARERFSEFLFWAVGAGKEVIFDETHLGIQRGSSIAILLREYHMEGLFFGLLMVAILWIWKNGASFVPAFVDESAKDNEIVKGKTAREGVVHLLEKNIPADQLPVICLKQWRKSHPNPTAFELSRIHEAEDTLAAYSRLPAKEQDPLKIYRRLTEILSPEHSQ